METLTSNTTDGNAYIFAEADCYLDNIPLLESGYRCFLDNYTLQDLVGSNLAVVMDAQKNGLLFPLEIPAEAFLEFITFGRQYCSTMTYGQIAALFHASRSNDQYVLVSRSPIVQNAAKLLSISVMNTIAEPLTTGVPANDYPPVFRNEVDEQKVFDTLREIRETKNSPLQDKSYWIVPMKVFKQYEWLCCTQKAFIERVNIEFNLKPALKKWDIGYATNQIAAKAKNFSEWQKNPYRDFAYKIQDVFFGKEEPWGASGFFVCSKEKNFTKNNIEIHHKKP